jgi:hypothetical protein
MRYEAGQTFAAAGADASGNVRIGLTLDGAQLPAFPFRWDLGGDLAPGQTRVIRGAARVPNQPGVTRYWLGVVDGDGRVVQDGVAPTAITIAPAARVEVVGPIARVLAERWAGAKVVATLPHGATATVIDYQDGWFLLRTDSGEGWAAENLVRNVAALETPPPATPAATPVAASESGGS